MTEEAAEIIAQAIRYAAHEIGKEGASGMGAIEGLAVNVSKIADAADIAGEKLNYIEVFLGSRIEDRIGSIADGLYEVANSIANLAEATRGN